MKRAFALVGILMLCGCSVVSMQTVHVHDYKPEIPVPPKPALTKLEGDDLKAFQALPDSAKKLLVGNSDALMLDNEKMRTNIEQYNDWAKKNNQSSRDALDGKKPTDKEKTDVKPD